MSGVWVFKNGVAGLVEKPGADSSEGGRKVLIYLPSSEVIASYSDLESKLFSLGWERFYSGDPNLLEFQKNSAVDFISLPKDFGKFNSIYMYDIAIKNPNVFEVGKM
ncbi:hypothetical protein K2173_022295 [Erythroxylum novogranatense]|uniref:Flowering-promoting factor 1 n=1 Tax=Erythroxylum novogranatense TaxID=1862640 RepID=A0AAV8THD1_9ROSI|nr:hypothetical protein K2173_022295 [Erythroxylum novogranatense]